MAEIRYDENKLRELLVLVADRSSEDPGFGATKLNKLLFFCDFYAYAYLGEPITGAEYQKLKDGPAPRRLLPVQNDLEREGAVRVVNRERMIYTQKVTVAQRPPDLSVFSPAQLELVEEVLDIFRRYDASTISEVSHRVSAGWNLAGLGEEIPYETALISMDPAPPEAIEMGREVAERLGW
jgi:hypothetical protein